MADVANPTNVTFESQATSTKSSPESSRSGSEQRGESGDTWTPSRKHETGPLTPASETPPAKVKEPAWPVGWRPYACLLGGFLLMSNSWGIVNAYGTFASYYKQHLLPDRDILLFNLVGSTESFVVLFLSAPVGRFLDAGHSRELIVIGTILVSLGTFLISAVNDDAGYNEGNYGLIWLTQGFITGLGMACFFVSSSQIVATWFQAKKGFAIGVVASGASIAGLVYPIMIKFLITEVGFNDAVRYMATVVTVTSLLAVFIARPNPTHQIRTPEKWLELRVFVDTQAFRNPAFVWFCAAISILFFGFYAVFFNLEEWAAASGLGYRDETPGGVNIALPQEVPRDAIRTFYLLCIMNGTSTVGRLTSSYLCDKFGALRVHATVTSVASLLILLLWTMARNVSAAIAFVTVFGVFSGAVIGLPPASVAYILGPHPAAQAKLGQWTGMMYSTSALFALTGPVIAGHLITEYGTYLTVQLWSGICLMLSAGCMGMAMFYMRHTSARASLAAQRSRLSSFAVSLVEGSSEKEKEEV